MRVKQCGERYQKIRVVFANRVGSFRWIGINVIKGHAARRVSAIQPRQYRRIGVGVRAIDPNENENGSFVLAQITRSMRLSSCIGKREAGFGSEQRISR